MAKPTTLLQLATLRRDAAKAENTAAQKRLAGAQTKIVAAREKLTKAANEQVALEKRAEAIRQKLPAAPTSADGEALLDALELVNIRSRARQAEALHAGSDLAAAQTAADQAQAAFTQTSAALLSVESEVKQTTQAEMRRNAWKSALTSPPLAALNNDANAALNAPPFPDAKARIELDLPEKLRVRSQERRTAEAARIAAAQIPGTAAEDALLEERAKNGGAAGQVAKARQAFLRAQAAAQEFAEHAQSQFEHAKATFATVADTTHSPLTPEATARLNDATLKDDRETAAAAEKELDAKRKDMDDKQSKLDEETLKALAAGKDPNAEPAVIASNDALKTARDTFTTDDTAWRKEFTDLQPKIEAVAAKQTALAEAIQKAVAAKNDPETDPDVTQAKSDLKTVQDSLKQAEKDYRKSNQGLLHVWAAAAPDATWRLFAQFEEAKATLTRLGNSDPAKLKSDLDKAETDYVKELDKAGASDGILDRLASEHATRDARRHHQTATANARLFGALRGDN
jgi:hypothetical protein